MVDEVPEDEGVEYDPIERIYDLVNGAINRVASETELEVWQIQTAMGLVLGEIAAASLECEIEEDEGEDADVSQN